MPAGGPPFRGWSVVSETTVKLRVRQCRRSWPRRTGCSRDLWAGARRLRRRADSRRGHRGPRNRRTSETWCLFASSASGFLDGRSDQASSGHADRCRSRGRPRLRVGQLGVNPALCGRRAGSAQARRARPPPCLTASPGSLPGVAGCVLLGTALNAAPLRRAQRVVMTPTAAVPFVLSAVVALAVCALVLARPHGPFTR